MSAKIKGGNVCWLVILSSILLMTLCHGQSEVIERGDRKKSQGRPVKIMYYMAPADAPEEAYIYAGAKQISLTELTRKNFSETFLIPKLGGKGARRELASNVGGPVKLSFLPRLLNKGERVPVGAPSVLIPKGWDKVLLLVFPDTKNSVMPIRVKAINASDDKFGPGSIYMLNFSNLHIFGSVGDKKLNLKAKSEMILKNPINRNGMYPVILQALVKGVEKPRRFIKQMWSNSDNTRDVLFFIPRPAPMHATYYCAPVSDF